MSPSSHRLCNCASLMFFSNCIELDRTPSVNWKCCNHHFIQPTASIYPASRCTVCLQAALVAAHSDGACWFPVGGPPGSVLSPPGCCRTNARLICCFILLSSRHEKHLCERRCCYLAPLWPRTPALGSSLGFGQVPPSRSPTELSHQKANNKNWLHFFMECLHQP